MQQGTLHQVDAGIYFISCRLVKDFLIFNNHESHSDSRHGTLDVIEICVYVKRSCSDFPGVGPFITTRLSFGY